ncbi:hypothetical protein TBK1r_38990 [Stieleria magnilauensis]|uniref:Uncharacterized protein n=1 Tax=Stieleria magnilauensis TaxID=2527963 RepID=A0ABX5XTM3_9BACT|nr:hypothetical protein TBK1r_38990 [Planctomycetes bacterium TBK1r]
MSNEYQALGIYGTSGEELSTNGTNNTNECAAAELASVSSANELRSIRACGGTGIDLRQSFNTTSISRVEAMSSFRSDHGE